MKGYIKKILLILVLFLIFFASFDFILPGLSNSSFIELKMYNVPYINFFHKILDFYRIENIVKPNIFRVGILSLIISSFIYMLFYLILLRKKEKSIVKKSSKIFVFSYLMIFFISLFFFIRYLSFLAKMRTPGGGYIIPDPGNRFYIISIVLILIGGALILLVSFLTEKDFNSPIKFFITIIFLVVFTRVLFEIPVVRRISTLTVYYPTQIYLEKFLYPPGKSVISGEKAAPATTVEKAVVTEKKKEKK